ncbi:MAG TPA: GGDEF domain-containing protein [Acidimicrobiales bacterium]|nr:GGDEF domain-containing protein [Acidimicrobiales bacterium]
MATDEERRREEERIGLRQEVSDLRARLAAAESHFHGVVEASTDGIVVVNREGVVVFANAAAAAMLGDTPTQLIGKQASFPMASTATRRADHEVFRAELRVLSTDWEGQPAVLALLRDVTEQNLADAEMAYRATHDPVTGLPNRYLFDDRLRQALARDRREPKRTLAILFCDIDGLKSINDRHGHAVGDAVLVEAARRIASVIRPSDTAAHLGGDEFVLLCEDVDDAGAAAVAARVTDAFDDPMEVEGVELVVGISVGAAVTTDPDAAPADLLTEADHAMYRIKQRRRRETFR